MQITMLDGRVSTMPEIADTTIDAKIRGQIGELLQNFWKKEKEVFKQMSVVVAELKTPILSNLQESSGAVCAEVARVGGANAEEVIVRRKSIAITESIRSFVITSKTSVSSSSLLNDSPTPDFLLREVRRKSDGHISSPTQSQGQNGNNACAEVDSTENSATVRSISIDKKTTRTDLYRLIL